MLHLLQLMKQYEYIIIIFYIIIINLSSHFIQIFAVFP